MPNTRRLDSSRAVNGSDQPWTKARCNRLLRPLKLSLSSLTASTAPELETYSNKHSNTESKCRAAAQCPSEATDNAEWADARPQKRQRMTYGFRANRRRAVSGTSSNQNVRKPCLRNPGEIVPITPLLCKARSMVSNKSDAQSESQENVKIGEINWTPEIAVPRGRKMDALEAVKVAFRNLLRQTQLHRLQPIQNIGAPSLFNMCLRNIPAHIQEEQEWRKEQDPDDRSDPAAEVYEFLEGLGCGDLEGWRHLRVIARAHGEFLIHSCIRNRTLQELHLRSLVKICLQEGCIEEAKRLLVCWINNLTYLPAPASPKESSFSLLNVLSMVSDCTGKHDFQYRVLKDLFETGSLSLNWVTTPAFKPVWHNSITSTSRMAGENEAATDFLRYILLSAVEINTMNPPSEDFPRLLQPRYLNPKTEIHCVEEKMEWEAALSNTVSSLCTIMAAIGSLKVTTEEPTRSLGSFSRGSDLVTHISHAKINDDAENGTRKLDNVIANRLVICASNLFLALNDDPVQGLLTNETIDLAITAITQLHKLYESHDWHPPVANANLSRFFCSIIQCSSRVEKESAFKLLQNTIQNMIYYEPASGSADGANQKHFLQKLAIETVLLSCEDYPDKEHVQFAQQIEKLLSCSKTLGKSKATGSGYCGTPQASLNGLRWEEGICEWVVATPASMLKKPVVLPSSGQTSPLILIDEFDDTTSCVTSLIEEVDSKVDNGKPITNTACSRSPFQNLAEATGRQSITRYCRNESLLQEPECENFESRLDDNKENVPVHKQSQIGGTKSTEKQAVVEAGDEDEDELSMSSFLALTGVANEDHDSFLGICAPASTQVAYRGSRIRATPNALDIEDLLSDELA